MAEYPIYWKGKYYMYSTVVDDYLSGPLDSPEDVADWASEHDQPGSTTWCLGKESLQLYGVYGHPCDPKSVQVSENQYRNLISGTRYRQAIAASTDTERETLDKIVKTPGGERSPTSMTFELTEQGLKPKPFYSPYGTEEGR